MSQLLAVLIERQAVGLLTFKISRTNILSMNNILQIRKQLGLSQVAFGKAINVSQGNVSHYEQGRQEVPPEVARRVIAAAEALGHAVTFDDIYQPAPGAEKAA